MEKESYNYPRNGKIVNKGGKEVGNVIGIDFGTSDSCVSVCKGRRMVTVPDARGERIIPSYVAINPEGKCFVGHAAKNQLTIKPENTIENIKRLIGLNFDDKALQKEIKHLPYKVIDKNNKPCIQVNTKSERKEFYPEEITAMIFKELKKTAENYLDEKVTDAVITVPANFNSRQRQAVIDAGSIARLKVRILNEPTSVAVGLYGNELDDSKKNVLVFKLGAGSFEVTILTKHHNEFKVIATGGVGIGGIDFSRRLLDYFVDIYIQKRKIDIRDNKSAMLELQKRIDRAKQTLSSFPAIEAVTVKSPGDKFILGQLTRSKFEELNENLFQSTIDTIQDVLSSAKMTRTDIDEVLLTGGSTQIPKIRQIVNNFFGCKELVYVSKGTTSIGTAKLASTLCGQKEDNAIVVSDVIGISLGIRLVRGMMGVMIPRNRSIPVKEPEIFTTTYDDQDVIYIKVYEGEHKMIDDNQFLDEFTLRNIEIGPKGVPSIEVTMEVNVDGVLKVSARDMTTESENTIAIDYFRKRFGQQEIEQMIHNIENV